MTRGTSFVCPALRQLGDIHRNPPRLVAREIFSATTSLNFEFPFADAAPSNRPPGANTNSKAVGRGCGTNDLALLPIEAGAIREACPFHVSSDPQGKDARPDEQMITRAWPRSRGMGQFCAECGSLNSIVQMRFVVLGNRKFRLRVVGSLRFVMSRFWRDALEIALVISSIALGTLIIHLLIVH